MSDPALTPNYNEQFAKVSITNLRQIVALSVGSKGCEMSKMKNIERSFLEKNLKDLDEICEECHKEDESVTQNLIMTGYKLCKSCRTSKTVFPI